MPFIEENAVVSVSLGANTGLGVSQFLDPTSRCLLVPSCLPGHPIHLLSIAHTSYPQDDPLVAALIARGLLFHVLRACPAGPPAS